MGGQDNFSLRFRDQAIIGGADMQPKGQDDEDEDNSHSSEDQAKTLCHLTPYHNET